MCVMNARFKVNFFFSKMFKIWIYWQILKFLSSNVFLSSQSRFYFKKSRQKDSRSSSYNIKRICYWVGNFFYPSRVLFYFTTLPSRHKKSSVRFGKMIYYFTLSFGRTAIQFLPFCALFKLNIGKCFASSCLSWVTRRPKARQWNPMRK